MAKSKPTLSLMVTTYNSEEKLNLYLQSALRQRLLPDEILVADDGSKEPTRLLVEEFARCSPIPIRHIWHEDDGFRLTVIRNKAIAAAQGEYIIQTDGDLLLHPDFVKDHAEAARRGFLASGSRLMLTPALTEKILRGEQSPEISLFTPGVQNRLNGLHLPGLGRLLRTYKSHRVRGCNMAFWRDEIIAVNGYNEEMTGWGAEDFELAIRMRNAGFRQQTLKFCAITAHLYHPERKGDRLTINQELQRRAEVEHLTRCEKGVTQYL